jgi:flagellar basal body-associated protein FliL
MLHEQQRAKTPSHEIKIIVIFLKGIIAIARSIYVFMFLPGKKKKEKHEIER